MIKLIPNLYIVYSDIESTDGASLKNNTPEIYHRLLAKNKELSIADLAFITLTGPKSFTPGTQSEVTVTATLPSNSSASTKIKFTLDTSATLISKIEAIKIVANVNDVDTTTSDTANKLKQALVNEGMLSQKEVDKISSFSGSLHRYTGATPPDDITAALGSGFSGSAKFKGSFYRPNQQRIRLTNIVLSAGIKNLNTKNAATKKTILAVVKASNPLVYLGNVDLQDVTLKPGEGSFVDLTWKVKGYSQPSSLGIVLTVKTALQIKTDLAKFVSTAQQLLTAKTAYDTTKSADVLSLKSALQAKLMGEKIKASEIDDVLTVNKKGGAGALTLTTQPPAATNVTTTITVGVKTENQDWKIYTTQPSDYVQQIVNFGTESKPLTVPYGTDPSVSKLSTYEAMLKAFKAANPFFANYLLSVPWAPKKTGWWIEI